jgi:hypothetical protein
VSELSPTRQYDVALSFAGEDRDYVEEVAKALRRKGLRVFYDRFEEADLIGRNLVDHLSDIYTKRARLCMVFVSSAYARKPYPRLERQAAQARAFEQLDQPYIVPIRLDSTEIPGLLPTVAFVSGKTPEALSQLIAAKLLLAEAPGTRLPEDISAGDTVLVRFASLLEPDMETFGASLDNFKHWSPDKLASIPVELRIPQELTEQIALAKAFRGSHAWSSPQISDDAREQFSLVYEKNLPALLADIIRGVQTLISYYNFAPKERLNLVVHRFLVARSVSLCRLLIVWRLVGMAPVKWEAMFAHFGYGWSQRIICDLAYAAFLEGEERFLWVDADAYDRSSTVWPVRIRVYVPAELVLAEKHEHLSSEVFDRCFAVQLLERELEGFSGQPLQYFAQYPDRLNLSIRGEWVVEAEHFGHESTTNNGGRVLFPIVRKLRAHAMAEAAKAPTEEAASLLVPHRIGRLFRESSVFDEVLYEPIA